jgi:hypothetical protein
MSLQLSGELKYFYNFFEKYFWQMKKTWYAYFEICIENQTTQYKISKIKLAAITILWPSFQLTLVG